ncbi:MAG TPA: hypothetical protein VHC95_04580 [Opitutales bacterium]|nr:hypothetical protein [Opitutales bacterium]
MNNVIEILILIVLFYIVVDVLAHIISWLILITILILAIALIAALVVSIFRYVLKLRREARFARNLAEVSNGDLVIGTEIWLDPRSEQKHFFDMLYRFSGKRKIKIIVTTIQFNSIKNSINHKDPNHKKCAKIAMRRIDQLQSAGLLKIETQMEGGKAESGREKLLNFIYERGRHGVAGVLISEDDELRIRSREDNRRHANADWVIIGPSDLLNEHIAQSLAENVFSKSEN